MALGPPGASSFYTIQQTQPRETPGRGGRKFGHGTPATQGCQWGPGGGRPGGRGRREPATVSERKSESGRAARPPQAPFLLLGQGADAPMRGPAPTPAPGLSGGGWARRGTWARRHGGPRFAEI